MPTSDVDRNQRNAQTLAAFALGNGGPNQVIGAAESFAVPKGSKIEIFGYVYDVSGVNNAPTDAPAGTFQLWAAPDENSPYVRVTEADTTDGMLKFSISGNNALVAACANFEDFPGVRGKILFVRSAAGVAGANARAKFVVVREQSGN